MTKVTHCLECVSNSLSIYLFPTETGFKYEVSSIQTQRSTSQTALLSQMFAD